MKNRIIIVILTLIPLIGFSQEYEYVPFPDSGVIWSEVYQPPVDSDLSWPAPIYERFALNGEDTIIDKIEYKKLYIFSDSVFNKSKATYIGGIREDENKRVYYNSDTVLHAFKPCLHSKEIVLFDFSLNVGDTLKTGNLSKSNEFLVVSAIDTIFVGNTLRKQYNFEPIYWVRWIEGIGSLKGLLFTSGDLPSNGIGNDLICFKQNNAILYFNSDYEDCFPLLTGIITKKNNNPKITLFPNPSEYEKITFDFGKQNNDIDRIQIIDYNGRVVEDCWVNMQSTYILSTEKYQPGIYFYKATGKDGLEHTGKFVVQ